MLVSVEHYRRECKDEARVRVREWCHWWLICLAMSYLVQIRTDFSSTAPDQFRAVVGGCRCEHESRPHLEINLSKTFHTAIDFLRFPRQSEAFEKFSQSVNKEHAFEVKSLTKRRQNSSVQWLSVT